MNNNKALVNYSTLSHMTGLMWSAEFSTDGGETWFTQHIVADSLEHARRRCDEWASEMLEPEVIARREAHIADIMRYGD